MGRKALVLAVGAVGLAGALTAAAFVAPNRAAAATPAYVPRDAATIVAHVPPRDPREVAERQALAAAPERVELAVELARADIQRARTLSDPRYLGRAQATLGRWWKLAEPPPDVLLLRATIEQSLHDFVAARADLDRLIATRPDDAQAHLTRAIVATVRADYAAARASCDAVARLAPPIVAATCRAPLDAMAGPAADATRPTAAGAGVTTRPTAAGAGATTCPTAAGAGATTRPTAAGAGATTRPTAAGARATGRAAEIGTSPSVDPAHHYAHAEAAYRALATALDHQRRTTPALRAWALTTLAELAVQRGDELGAERHLEAALAIDPEDAYARAALADTKLAQHDPAGASALLAGYEQIDNLLVRRAIAEHAAHGPEAARLAKLMHDRIAAAAERGDRVHQREEAMFVLAVDGDAPRALAIARANWDVQKELADARVLVEAAVQAGQPDAAAPVVAWAHANGIEDARLDAWMRRLP
jgi:tetratricopeptide (TPR) repeat protein